MTVTQPSLLGEMVDAVRGEPDIATFPSARATDPDTSHEAGKRNPVGRATDRHRALVALADGPLTDFELADRTGRAQTSIGKRRRELVSLGFVESTGERRPSPSGSPALVWRVT